jgi:hypothetical protein
LHRLLRGFLPPNVLNEKLNGAREASIQLPI